MRFSFANMLRYAIMREMSRSRPRTTVQRQPFVLKPWICTMCSTGKHERCVLFDSNGPHPHLPCECPTCNHTYHQQEKPP